MNNFKFEKNKIRIDHFNITWTIIFAKYVTYIFSIERNIFFPLELHARFYFTQCIKTWRSKEKTRGRKLFLHVTTTLKTIYSVCKIACAELHRTTLFIHIRRGSIQNVIHLNIYVSSAFWLNNLNNSNLKVKALK